jgi:quinol monooxygenase YgiN
MLTVNDQKDVEKIRALLIEQAGLASAEPGCVRFEVYHSQHDPAFFLLVEQWESRQHLDQHREARAFREIYIPKVLPLVNRVPHPSERLWPLAED